MERDTNIHKYQRTFSINIGSIIFGIIFIYFMFNILMYLTETHIAKYEVEYGTMAANNVYTGLIIRDETVYHAEHSGALNYYVKEYSKVGYYDLIYSVDEKGSVSNKLNVAKQEAAQEHTVASEGVIELLNDFQLSYDKTDFYQVYTLKDEMNSFLNEALSLNALDQIAEYADSAEGNTFHRIKAEKDGIVSYYVDEFESVTTENFTPAMLNETSYERTILNINTEVSAGSPVYKMINSETWHIVLPVSAELAQELEEKREQERKEREEKAKKENKEVQEVSSVIRIRFIKDKKEMYAEYDIKQNGEAYYLILTMKNAMVRYASERYLDIELLLTEKTGLKIPNSAIVEKEFYMIPKEYFRKDEKMGKTGIYREEINNTGNTENQFISPTVYLKTDTHYYIDSESVTAGDVLIDESTNRYVVGEDTTVLQGVYNVNKGYSVFKQVKIMFQNEEYAIVEKGTDYGIALYDHIALDGSKIKDHELVK